MRKAAFAAVVNAATQVLVLGSLPGEASLAAAQYYAHPQNQFWRLMGAVIGMDLDAAPYRERLAMVLAAGVGLWDVIESAERMGSLDGAIRNHTPAPLDALVASLPCLTVIAFNGAKASQIGRKQLGVSSCPALITLPSSSPAHTLPLASKQTEWMKLRPFLVHQTRA
ncbi:MAG TPA: DNA-deoxyinosine glycosylase [Caulobacteraceae bacterium]